ncbi:hypothetical protein GUITHDRAFT_101177 [Guillardia theta CCMP2712]|uniref:Uncharacterized protein n=1 Tax=Guillardia theta (strain CCMP2712) TaxID=905079 RepID=L1JY25_GUITC|nr:hypothetical protein GUITHDRAFT_101177 [Guillardia theta CCMP2712]EKX53476.1 hypothetical protein GUITHDRAFT_101177 [Guillardia theta CCMP2712]|eukprot:XP_005840456.1 hypothetical protein GUITHDRAFT_101177 [Guillardia theta CCMP2712]
MPPKQADNTRSKLADKIWAALNLNTKQTKETALAATFSFAALLVAILYQNFDDAMIWMEWIESYKVDIRSIKAGDQRILNMCKTAFGCYATTIVGYDSSLGTHVFSAFLLAWWLTFCSPFDIWHNSMKTPWLMIPIKAFATISSAHAITSWGMEKALNAEHERMRKSVWAALLCGFTSGSFGWVVVSYFETGGSAIVASAPTWAMQRAWYLVWVYYGLTDPHGILQHSRQAVGSHLQDISPVLSTLLLMKPISKSAGKVVVATCCLVLQFALDICCYDLLIHLNRFFAIFWRTIAPLKIDRVYVPPKSD